MEKIEVLKALLAKVEAGDRTFSLKDTPLRGYGELVQSAYNGSLDAAKALHEAALDGWSWSAPHQERFTLCHTDFYEQNGSHHTNPARAWLIAIIKALIAKEEL